MDLQTQLEDYQPLFHDFGKALVIFSVLFGTAFLSYLMLSLLFFSFKTFLVLFSIAVAWGTCFNYSDRKIQAHPDEPCRGG